MSLSRCVSEATLRARRRGEFDAPLLIQSEDPEASLMIYHGESIRWLLQLDYWLLHVSGGVKGQNGPATGFPGYAADNDCSRAGPIAVIGCTSGGGLYPVTVGFIVEMRESPKSHNGHTPREIPRFSGRKRHPSPRNLTTFPRWRVHSPSGGGGVGARFRGSQTL